MKNILYACEYGISLERIKFFLPISKKLRTKGYCVRVSVPFSTPNFFLIKEVLVENELDFLDGPSAHMEVNIPIGSHAELMQQLSCFKTPADFELSFKSWLTLLERESPDLLICDHAPAALLTARQLSIPTVLFDLGFFVPDTTHFLPSFIDSPICSLQTIHKVAISEAEKKSEEHLLKIVNATFSQLNFSPLEKFADFYKADKTLWLNRAEPSIFTHTSNTPNVRTTVLENEALLPNWKLNRFESPKIFAYLKQDDPNSMIIIQALRYQQNIDSIIYIPNCHIEIKRAYDSNNLTIEYLPMNIQKAVKDANLIINNADAGLIAQSLLAGKPTLLVPTSFEQCLNANKAIKLGAAITLEANLTHALVCDGIYTLLRNGFYTVSARAFALKYQPIDTESITNTISASMYVDKNDHFVSVHKNTEDKITN